jgi:hypothetical protein
MKKIVLLSLLFIGMIGTSMGQMVIPGEVFTQKPVSFNGRVVSVKNIQLDFSNKMMAPIGAVAPVGPVSHASVAPGPNGSNTPVGRCNPPRGFVIVDVDFIADPEYQGCFFMSETMYQELKRQAGGQKLDAQITFRGDSRIGYNITFYKIGR